MKLLRYKLSRIEPGGWDFDEVLFGRINLLVGDSGTGKSRLLNTIVNFSRQIISQQIIHTGDWDADFDINGRVYNYRLVVKNSTEDINVKDIVLEKLTIKESGQVLVNRTPDSFFWKDQVMPKMTKTISTIMMLKDEEEIRDIYAGFRRIVARRFFGDELERNFLLGALAPETKKRLIEKKDAQFLLNEEIDFHNKMNLLQVIDPEMEKKIVNLYKSAFPFIVDISVQPFSQLFKLPPMSIESPVFCIKEKDVPNWIPVNDISSGMQKIFLLILDLFLMKDSGILLIDEYENSLGINAINFLPDLIYTISEKCQFIITSHHPYIINNIDIENWHVFHRSGLHVSIKSGKELKEKYKASKQEQFVQLINDPFFTSGVQ